MNRIIKAAVIFIIALSTVFSVCAEDCNVIYKGKSEDFIFEPGSEYSPTDLFANFKGVMPGDSLTQQITVKNNADNKVKVKIYIRSLGAHKDSVKFLSQLRLNVEKSQNNKMAYMFDAAANETAQLTDWVCLGTLYSGGEVDLDVTLSVPAELDNEFQDKIGYLDWEFMTREFPIDSGDPKPPQTGDNSQIVLWFLAAIFAVAMLFVLLFRRKKDKEE